MKRKILYHIASSWIEIATGLVGACTWGFYRPYWDIKWVTWYSRKTISKKMREQA